MNYNRLKPIYIFILLLLSFASCKEDEPMEPDTIPGKYASGVFVLNEGNFTQGNASISFYDPAASTVEEAIFSVVNNRPLGDIVQSMIKQDSLYYIVVNNSGKIEVVNEDFESVNTIEGLNSPRYIHSVNNSTLLVSNFGPYAYLIDHASMSLRDSVEIGTWTDRIAVNSADDVWMVSLFESKLVQFNFLDGSNFSTVEQSMPLSPSSIAFDDSDRIFALVGDGYHDPVSLNIYNSGFSLDQSYDLGYIFGSGLHANPSKQNIYYLNGGVYEISNSSNGPIEKIAADGRSLYGIGVNPESGDIYISDAIDFQQNGKIYVYNPAGLLEAEFDAGIIPGNFYFVNE